MGQPFHMTGGLRVVSTIIITLLRIGLLVGPSVLLSVRGRKSGKTCVSHCEQERKAGVERMPACSRSEPTQQLIV